VVIKISFRPIRSEIIMIQMDWPTLKEWIVYAYVLFTLFYANVIVSTYKCLYFTGDLNLPVDWYGYIQAFQKLAALVSMPLVGLISDRIGRKEILITTLL
jgi:MFS family permease